MTTRCFSSGGHGAIRLCLLYTKSVDLAFIFLEVHFFKTPPPVFPFLQAGTAIESLTFLYVPVHRVINRKEHTHLSMLAILR
jgi:hypothetical protein